MLDGDVADVGWRVGSGRWCVVRGGWWVGGEHFSVDNSQSSSNVRPLHEIVAEQVIYLES